MREAIINYFKIKDEIKETVDKILNKSISLQDVEKSGNARYPYTIYKMVKILEEKKAYYDAKLRYEATMEDYIKGRKTCREIQKNCKISNFYKEVKKMRAKLGEKYQYDKQIKNGTSSFTYQKEETLLKKLCNLINSFRLAEEECPECCTCRVCIMELLSRVAYEYVRDNKIRYHKNWDWLEGADLDWLKEFDMRHSISDFCYTLNCRIQQESNW